MASGAPYPSQPILLVDDEEQALTSYALNLRFSGITNTVLCSDSRTVAAELEKKTFSLLVLDLSMPHVGGEQLLAHMREQGITTPAIVITGHNEVETAVRCMQAGAVDYLVKPVDRARLLDAVAQALQRPVLEAGAAPRPQPAGADASPQTILTTNAAMHAVVGQLRAVASSPEPVLVVGETGVGKELAAWAIHAHSRQGVPFIGCNVAGLDDVMLSDTLFGHKKGAYTGAQVGRGGLMEEAGEGTLFLDEIGDLSMTSQLKLLRCIQEREFYPLGADTPQPLRCRLVAATNRSVRELMDASIFRRDLFFRLRTHLIEIPPLRDRLEDLPLLIPAFLAEAAAQLGCDVPAVPDDLYPTLEAYHFPGNVRELKSMCSHALALHRTAAKEQKALSIAPFTGWMESVRQGAPLAVTGGGGGPAASPPEGAGGSPTLKQATGAIAAGLIEEALAKANGNKTLAAQLLGISRQALYKRLKAMRNVNPG